MKSLVAAALVVVGVFGTATVATAINADTMFSLDQGTLGNAIEVLVPVVTENKRSTPVPSPVPSPVETTPAVTPTVSPLMGSLEAPSGIVAPTPTPSAAPAQTGSGAFSHTSPTSGSSDEGSVDDSSSGHENNETEDDD